MTYLYKYRSLSAKSCGYVERIICHDELYFPKPSSFNDPFDCRPVFTFEATDKEITSYYEKLLKKFKPDLNRNQRRQEAKTMLKDPDRNPKNPKSMKRIQREHTNKITEKTGVLCLSSKPDDILMWSHYADSHQGICIKFNWQFEFYAQSQEVKYPPIRPRINPYRQSNNEMLEAALLTKSEQWRYENEWRLIQYLEGPGVYKVPPQALTGIILGAQISKKNREKVIGWVKERNHPVKLYSASLCDKSFSLNIEPVS